MFKWLEILTELIEWFVDAAVAYNHTDVGSARLMDLENRIEAAGIDIPGYEPSPAGEPLDLGNSTADPLSDAQAAAKFKAKHPEIFGGQS